MQAIQQIDENTYTLSARGSDMKLKRREKGGWEMFTDNASRRAHRGLGHKTFATLLEVEAQYKSWRGISKLVEESA